MDAKDRIRVEEFRQLRKEIRGSETHLIVGIDVAKDKHHAFIGTAIGDAPLVVMDPQSAGRSGKFSAAVAAVAKGRNSSAALDGVAKSPKSSWLMDFLVDAARASYNPFDPLDKIRIKISDNDK